jgi:hypothetical protein
MVHHRNRMAAAHARGAAAFASRWLDDVVEAYRATYTRTDASLITVGAIQFNDERLATATPPQVWTNVGPSDSFACSLDGK